jgi:hypothetical protein
MIKVDMVALGIYSKVEAIVHINGGDIECMMSFDFADLSGEARNDILVALQKHFDSLTAREQINLLPK